MFIGFWVTACGFAFAIWRNKQMDQLKLDADDVVKVKSGVRKQWFCKSCKPCSVRTVKGIEHPIFTFLRPRSAERAYSNHSGTFNRVQ